MARQVTLEVLVGTLDEGDKVRSLGLGCASDSMARGTFPRRRASDTGVRGRERAKGRSCCEERPIRLLHRPCCGRRGDLRTTIGGSTEGAAERGGNNISVRGSVDASVHPRALTDPPGPLRQEPSVDASNTRPPNNHIIPPHHVSALLSTSIYSTAHHHTPPRNPQMKWAADAVSITTVRRLRERDVTTAKEAATPASPDTEANRRREVPPVPVPDSAIFALFRALNRQILSNLPPIAVQTDSFPGSHPSLSPLTRT